MCNLERRCATASAAVSVALVYRARLSIHMMCVLGCPAKQGSIVICCCCCCWMCHRRDIKVQIAAGRVVSRPLTGTACLSGPG